MDRIDTHIGPIELINGYPTPDSVSRLYDELDFQRAVQAYIWATPIVAFEALRCANVRDWGVDDNAVGIVDQFTSPAVIALTGNSTTIYAAAFLDLERDGAVVIESPAGAYGVVDDFWQRPLVEIGPFGPDKGQGGRFVIHPPGGTTAATDDGFAVKSTTHRVLYLVRGIVKDGNVQAAVDTLSAIRIYPRSLSADPPPTRIFKAGKRGMDSIAPRGFDYWHLLANVLDKEPVDARDRFFHAMLRPLGIIKGQRFEPDARQTRLLTEAAAVGFLMAQTISMAPRFEGVTAYAGTHWEWVITLNPNQEAEHYSQLDERTDYTFEAITMAAGMVKQIIGAGSQYMSAGKDQTGEWLDGGRTYALRIPPSVPAKDFWSVTVYDNLTRSMVQNNAGRAALSSYDPLATESDGSIVLRFGPEPPPEGGSNWIGTLPGKGWFVYFRWYGPTEAFFDGSWSLPDITPEQTP
jgi:hypothetical protein